MIKNWLPLAVLLLAADCHRQRAQLTGYQGVLEYEEQDLAFEVSGRLSAVEVQPGAHLRAGTVIARLDDSLARTALLARQSEAAAAEDQLRLLRAGARSEDVRAMRARLEAAQASEALLERNAERMRRLTEAAATTRAALDEAESQLERARAERRSVEENLQALSRGARAQEVEAARHRLEAAQAAADLERERIARHTLVAAGAGEVLQVHLQTGEMAPAGAPVVTTADVGRPYAEVFVPQAEIGNLRVGTPAVARTDSAPGGVQGRVEVIGRRTEFTPRYLFSESERSNLVIRVRVRLQDAEGRLHAGLPVFVRFGGSGSGGPLAADARSGARP
jgi:HlyD family secretion protein